jgi:Flp pilus assembly pilin Flp
MERSDGQELAEYVLLGSLISVAAVAASNQIAAALIALFTKTATTLTWSLVTIRQRMQLNNLLRLYL